MSATIINEERDALYGFVARVAGAASPRSMLDVACGDGKGATIIAAAAPRARIVGVDIAESLIRAANASCASANVTFQTGDARALPFPDGQFDVISSCHTLEHFDEPDQHRFLTELHRVLAPGGTLIIATPDREVWALLGIAGQQEDHIRELTQAEFIALVAEHGFSVDGRHGQAILKARRSSVVRGALNVLKRLDVFRLRDLIRPTVKAVDRATSPVAADIAVRELAAGEKASVTVLMCRKSAL